MKWFVGLFDISKESLLGVAAGALLGLVLWRQFDGTDGSLKSRKKERRIHEDDMRLYNGKGNRLHYIAVGEEVFDVTCDKSKFENISDWRFGDKDWPGGDESKFRAKYDKVGSLVVMQNFTKDTLKKFDGRDGRPVYICLKGVVYEAGKEFYGPEGPYGIMAGNDASRALALMSLDQEDIDNCRIDDLSSGDLESLDDWACRFESKYRRVGYLVDKKCDAETVPTFLKKQRQQVTLHEKIAISHDTVLLRFRLPNQDSQLGLPIGNHIKFWCRNPKPVKEGEWNGRADPEAGKHEIERKYTPTSLDDERVGHFDLIIKVYSRKGLDKFPDGGKMSQYLESITVGDRVDVAGPFGLVEYKGKGSFRIRKKDRVVKHVGMIAGGTGITPMLQLIKAILRDPQDETRLSLLYANQSEDDILVRDMLEDESRKHPERLKIHYTVDRAAENWAYSEGFVNEDMIKDNLPLPSPDTVILMCGPPSMIKFACKPNLTKLGYSSDSQIEF